MHALHVDLELDYYSGSATSLLDITVLHFFTFKNILAS